MSLTILLNLSVDLGGAGEAGEPPLGTVCNLTLTLTASEKVAGVIAGWVAVGCGVVVC
jgi:hypothetical protein